jgi:hypothetical protein
LQIVEQPRIAFAFFGDAQNLDGLVWPGGLTRRAVVKATVAA